MDLKNKLFTNKNIGIWGFGVVGKSAAKYFVSKLAKTLTPENQQAPENKQTTKSKTISQILSKHNQSLQEKSKLEQSQRSTESRQTPFLQLEVIDKRELTEQEREYLQKNNINFVNQNDTENFKNFLENNDLIIPSPGVDLRKYKQYSHKFVSEFDLFQAELHAPIIGVTGTVGKTTVTHMLDQIIKTHGVNIWTGGNIGTPVLDVITSNCTEITPPPQTQSHQEIDLVLLELSSFQLELCKTFAPDLAIWTNFFPNHLDKHSDMQEYFLAKMQILANQTSSKCALLPISLLDKLEPFLQKQVSQEQTAQSQTVQKQDTQEQDTQDQAYTQINSKLYFFSENKPAQEIIDKLRPQDTLFYLDEIDKQTVIKLTQKISPEKIGSIAPLEELAEFTFRENLLIIFASLYIFEKYILEKQVNKTKALSDPNFSTLIQNFTKSSLTCQIEHRLEKVTTITGIEFYNDSKATTAASTIAAVQKMASKNKPIILLLGGLSKGVDRSPMIKEIKKYAKHVKLIISFGKEAEIIKNMCDKEGLTCESFENLQQAVSASFLEAHTGDQVLLSPSGSSFDLFKDYQDRGHKFKEIVLDLSNKQKPTKQRFK